MAEWNLTSWIAEVEEYTNAEIRRMTEHAFQRILARTPVRTGRLKAGWVLHYALNQGILEATIINEVEYVLFVEYGTYKMAPRAMVEQTLRELEEGLL